MNETFEILKYGCPRSITLVNLLEDTIPGVTRNFKSFYHNMIMQAIYDRKFKYHVKPDGMSYSKEIRHVMHKEYCISYEFKFQVIDYEDYTTVIMNLQSNHCGVVLPKYASRKETIIKSKQHFYDLVIEWQAFLDNRIGKLIVKLPKDVYELPKQHRLIYPRDYDNYSIYQEHQVQATYLLNDISLFIEKLKTNLDSIKSFQ